MKRVFGLAIGIAMVAMIAIIGMAQDSGPNKVLQKARVGGEGRFDYV